MQFINPFQFVQPNFQNTLEDFEMPYRLHGREDRELLKSKYLKLADYSIGQYIRCGEMPIK